MKKTTILDVIVILYVILFLYTAISKIMDYSIFKEQIATSPLLAPISKPIAWSLPWTEFLVTVFLVTPRWRLKGLIAAFTLMVLFTVYIIGILTFNKNIPCSCGGALEALSWGQHIVFNMLFIALAITGIILQIQIKRENRNELLFIDKNSLIAE
jgi:uncharacterized membrane protein YphA (DoxX/SURF4 family)